MVSRALFGLLALVLLQASLACAGDAIRFSTSGGSKRAELNLNPDTRCIPENDHISCGRASR